MYPLRIDKIRGRIPRAVRPLRAHAGQDPTRGLIESPAWPRAVRRPARATLALPLRVQPTTLVQQRPVLVNEPGTRDAAALGEMVQHRRSDGSAVVEFAIVVVWYRLRENRNLFSPRLW